MKRVIKERHFSGTTDSKEQLWEREHRKIARKAAADGMVLLKNKGNILPLVQESKIALYGAGASQTIKGGNGSGDVNERESVSIYQGLKNAGFHITTEDWIREYDRVYTELKNNWREYINQEVARRGGGDINFWTVYCTKPFQIPAGPEIMKAEETCDVAIYVISRTAGEGADRFVREGDYYLTEDEHERLKDICQLYKDVIVVVNSGGQIDLSFMDEFNNINGLILMMQAGMEGGNALADVISGKVSPSGKLTDTWVLKYEDYPNATTFSHNNGDTDTEVYQDGIYVGYRYFDTFQIPVRYEFGFGMSYTKFELVNVNIEKEDANKIKIEVDVRNTGGKNGKEVVEAYTSLPEGRIEKEAHRLIGFTKTKELVPGETQKKKISIPLKYFASYCEEQSAWILEKGMYEIKVGNSLSSAEVYSILNVSEDLILEKTKNICISETKIEELSCSKRVQKKNTEKEIPVINLNRDAIVTQVIEYKENKEIYPKDAMEFVRCLTTEECIKLAAGDPGKAQGSNLGAAGVVVPGSAGETSNCAMEKGLASMVLADGPAGLRLNQVYYVDNGKIVDTPLEFNLEKGIFYDREKELPGEKYYQYCTAIPTGTLLAQTWDTELICEVGHMIGEEMNDFGVTLWLAPGMNIHRNPLCGRNFEYYSEDPVISGKCAAAMTKGVQENTGCGTTIKHFACNNQEDNRQNSNSVVSERALREIYLRGFEIAVKESQPMAIMTSYNLINGVHTANNYDLCTNIARNEWKFDGLIMTDWTTTSDKGCTAAGCMRAGNDLVMPGCNEDYINLKKELEEGTLSEEDLRVCVARLVNICWKSNQYEEV